MNCFTRMKRVSEDSFSAIVVEGDSDVQGEADYTRNPYSIHRRACSALDDADSCGLRSSPADNYRRSNSPFFSVTEQDVKLAFIYC